MNPACTDCPVRQKAAGCGYLAAGMPCQHPRYRDVWAAANLPQSRNVTEVVTDGDAKGEGDV